MMQEARGGVLGTSWILDPPLGTLMSVRKQCCWQCHAYIISCMYITEYLCEVYYEVSF